MVENDHSLKSQGVYCLCLLETALEMTAMIVIPTASPSLSSH